MDKLIEQTAFAAGNAALYRVVNESEDGFFITISGRVRWALDQLIEAGLSGCTPIWQAGPRWSDYVYRLRALGIQAETIREPHGGDFPGNHGRYVLRSHVVRC